MASTYSALKLELIATGEQAGVWGQTTDLNFGDGALGEAITGSADVSFTGSSGNTVTLSYNNTNTSQQFRNLRLNLIGTTAATQTLIVPAIEKFYIVNNTCANDVIVKNATGTGTTVPTGQSMFLFNDATNVNIAATYFGSTVVDLNSAQTLTNKRITSRIYSQTTATSWAINSDNYDEANITALASGLTIAVPSGTPTQNQKLILRYKDNGTSQTLTWTGTTGGWRAMGTVLPTATTAGKTTYIGAIYNTTDSFWDVVAIATQN